MPGRKIDETRVGILDLDTEAVELLECLPEPVRGSCGLLLEGDHRARIKPAAVSGHTGAHRGESKLELGEPLARRHEALDCGPDGRQSSIRFLRRKEPHDRDTS
jgi:hypothetical protein